VNIRRTKANGSISIS